MLRKGKHELRHYYCDLVCFPTLDNLLTLDTHSREEQRTAYDLYVTMGLSPFLSHEIVRVSEFAETVCTYC